MKIAVYCSAKDQIGEKYLRLGDELGNWIAAEGHTLVYGGATGGLMSRVSTATKQAHGYVIGIIPEKIIRAGRKASHCDELIVVNDMAERKRSMREIADIFVCMPGSYGTLDEMFDVIASGTIGEHRKSIYILNYEGFYEGLKNEITHMKELCFLPVVEHYRPIFVDTLGELFTLINK